MHGIPADARQPKDALPPRVGHRPTYADEDPHMPKQYVHIYPSASTVIGEIGCDKDVNMAGESPR